MFLVIKLWNRESCGAGISLLCKIIDDNSSRIAETVEFAVLIKKGDPT